jgi:hypothetical protein
VQRKSGGVDLSLDVSEPEGLSEEELRRRYDAQSCGGARVPGKGAGREDFSKDKAGLTLSSRASPRCERCAHQCMCLLVNNERLRRGRFYYMIILSMF